jgi:hypothetical protein
MAWHRVHGAQYDAILDTSTRSGKLLLDHTFAGSREIYWHRWLRNTGNHPNRLQQAKQ